METVRAPRRRSSGPEGSGPVSEASAERARLTARRVAVALLAVGYFVAVALSDRFEWYPIGLEGYVVLGVACLLALGTGTRWPLRALTGALAYTLVTTFGFVPVEFSVRPPEVLVPLAIVVFLAITSGAPRFAVVGPYILCVLLVVVEWDGIAGDLITYRDPNFEMRMLASSDRSSFFSQLIAFGTVALLAVALRRERAVAEQLAERNRELVELRAAEAVRIVERERTQMAREVHDEVAHHVAALVIQAQAALRVADRHPDALPHAVEGLIAGGKDVLAAIRRVVRVLKALPTEADEATLVPVLESVFDRVRATGIRVDADLQVTDPVPPLQRSAIVGVVQEALTNTMVHSAARSVAVALRQTDDHWEVVVTDPGPAQERFPDVPQGGTGIPSMIDRVTSVGGRLSSGPDPAGPGWLVRADLPRGVVTVSGTAA